MNGRLRGRLRPRGEEEEREGMDFIGLLASDTFRLAWKDAS